MKKVFNLKKESIVFLFVFLIGINLFAETTLTWDPVIKNEDGSSISNLAGYRLFYAEFSLLSMSVEDAMSDTSVHKMDAPPNEVEAQISLPLNTTYYCRLVAFNAEGIMSVFNIDGMGDDIEIMMTNGSTNYVPVISPVDASSLYEGELLEKDIFITDPNINDQFILNCNPLLSNVSLNQISSRHWKLLWQTDFQNQGEHAFSITANDGTETSPPVILNVQISDVDTNLQLTNNGEWM